eukprot:1146976-Pelagomonas_calceolata.AAC.7
MNLHRNLQNLEGCLHCWQSAAQFSLSSVRVQHNGTRHGNKTEHCVCASVCVRACPCACVCCQALIHAPVPLLCLKPMSAKSVIHRSLCSFWYRLAHSGEQGVLVRDIKEAEENLRKAGADAAHAAGAEEEAKGQGIILKRMGNKAGGGSVAKACDKALMPTFALADLVPASLLACVMLQGPLA